MLGCITYYIYIYKMVKDIKDIRIRRKNRSQQKKNMGFKSYRRQFVSSRRYEGALRGGTHSVK